MKFRLPFDRGRFAFIAVSFTALIFFPAFAISISAQRIAVIAPNGNDRGLIFANTLSEAFEQHFRVVEGSMATSAFESVTVENPYNLTLSEAKEIGRVIGCDFFVLIAAATQRRSSSAKPEYFEAHAAIFLASSRTGRLVHWTVATSEANSPESADGLLIKLADKFAIDLGEKVTESLKSELNPIITLAFEGVPDANAPLRTSDFRPPMPYKRTKPEYTTIAYLYDIRATVDISVDIGSDGEVANTEIMRWAGYGLDESVIENVRKMNWRPATQKGGKLPMRVLLRYNFTKTEKTEQ